MPHRDVPEGAPAPAAPPQGLSADQMSAVRGMVASATFDFHGFSNASMAQFAATRELKTHTYPLMQVKVIANRVAWQFRMGGVFRITWPQLGIEKMVVRIASINYGALENARIEITCVEERG